MARSSGGLKPAFLLGLSGTAEAVPFPKRFMKWLDKSIANPELLWPRAAAELRSAWTGEGARPHTSRFRKSAFPVMIQAVHRGKHRMINGKRIAVVFPAYNAEKTLEATVRELPDLVDIRILVDDHSSDRTLEVAHQLGLRSFAHNRNYGYGRNQQTCYREALAAGADVVIMVHPDYQYTPLLVTAMASMIAYGVYDVVLGSRILGGQARQGGMPLWKYVANRFLTLFENTCLGAKLSEYHTGDRAFSRTVLKN